MTLAALIEKGGLARLATATSATPATERLPRTANVADVANVAVANDRRAEPRKPTIWHKLAAANDPDPQPAVEARRRRVVALLEQHPDWRYAFVVENEPGLVVVHVGIRGKATGEVVIDAGRYDPVEFMQYLDRAAEQAESPAGGGHA